MSKPERDAVVLVRHLIVRCIAQTAERGNARSAVDVMAYVSSEMHRYPSLKTLTRKERSQLRKQAFRGLENDLNPSWRFGYKFVSREVMLRRVVAAEEYFAVRRRQCRGGSRTRRNAGRPRMTAA